MKQWSRFLLVMLLALGISIGATGGAFAQEGNPWGVAPDPVTGTQGDTGAGDEVQKTFELTLVGDVPEGELAIAVYETAEGGDFIVFCGPAEFEGGESCEAGTYTSEPVTLPAGTEVSFVFLAGDPNADEPKFIEEGTEIITEDMTNAATFDYGGGKDDQQEGAVGDDDQKAGEGDDQQDELPTTGGVPVGIPTSGIAAALGLLVIGGYSFRRFC